MTNKIDGLLTQAYYKETEVFSSEIAQHLKNKISEIAFPNLDTGIGLFLNHVYKFNCSQRVLYRISPELRKTLPHECDILRIENSNSNLQSIAQEIISLVHPALYYCHFSNEKMGLDNCYMSLWQDMVNNNETESYKFVKEVIAAPYQGEKGDSLTEITFHLDGENFDQEMKKAEELCKSFSLKIQENSIPINDIAQKYFKNIEGEWFLVVPDDSLEIGQIRDRLSDRTTGMKIMINTYVKDNLPNVYECFRQIFKEALKPD